jgi:hypothetical protein
MVGVPLYIGGCAGVIAVAAAVGALGLAIAAAIAGGAAWAGIGALLAAAIARHQTFNAAAARRVPLRVQGRVNSGRAIWATMCQMDPPDLGQQGAIGRLARAPTTSGIIARQRDAHHIAHDANRKRARWSSMRRNFSARDPECSSNS